MKVCSMLLAAVSAPRVFRRSMPLCGYCGFLFSINYFRKNICRVLWFVLNKLLSQKKKKIGDVTQFFRNIPHYSSLPV